MPKLSENGRNVLERWTVLFGGVEMLIGAAMAAFPDVFPVWLAYVAFGIAVVTIGVGVTLVWTDIGKIASTVRVPPSWIGPIVSILGLLILLGPAFWYVYQAPKGTFAGSSVGIVLVAAALLFALAVFDPRKKERALIQGAVEFDDDAERRVEMKRLRNRIQVIDEALHKLMGLEIDRLERVVMTNLIADSPKFSDDEDISTDSLLMGDRTSQLQRYVSLVMHEVSTMQGGKELPLAIHTTEANEIARLKNSPDVAPGVNAHVYRDYAIAVAKRKRAIEYMKKAIGESERSDMQYLGEMIANEKNLEPKNFNSGF